MDAFLFVRVRTGTTEDVIGHLLASKGVRHAVTVVGDWDVIAFVHGPDLPGIAGGVIREIHRIDGVERTLTSPVVPADVVGLAGGGLAAVLPMQRDGDACYVRVRTSPESTAHAFETLTEMEHVAGVALIAGEYDILAEVPYPWDEAVRVVLERIRPIPGVEATSTLIAVPYLPAEDEDRDQFSAWS